MGRPRDGWWLHDFRAIAAALSPEVFARDREPGEIPIIIENARRVADAMQRERESNAWVEDAVPAKEE